MIVKIKNFVVALAVIGFAASSFSASAKNTMYLNTRSLDLQSFPAPPVSGSELDARDMDVVRSYQVARTSAQCQRAYSEATAAFQSFFGAPYGPLDEKEIKALHDLYIDVLITTDAFVVELKHQYNRPRPYLRDKGIKLCVPPHGAPSYPSGHAAISQAAARVLSAIFPDRHNALLARAAQIGEDRVLGGVHHPSDIEAGRLLGDMVFNALMRNKDFQSRLLNLQKALRASNHEKRLSPQR
jgi:acid phosphatase (class A)